VAGATSSNVGIYPLILTASVDTIVVEQAFKVEVEIVDPC